VALFSLVSCIYRADVLRVWDVCYLGKLVESIPRSTTHVISFANPVRYAFICMTSGVRIGACIFTASRHEVSLQPIPLEMIMK